MGFFSGFWSLIKLLLELLGLIDQAKRAQDLAKAAEDERLRQERHEAIEDSKKAVTDDEIFDSQSRIVGARPKP